MTVDAAYEDRPQRGRERDRVAGGLRRTASGAKPSVVPVIFIITLIIPLILYLGPLRLSPYRLLLLVMFVPMLMKWLSGEAGPIRAPDVLLLAFTLWAGLAMTVNHGISQSWQGNGIFVVECFGSYLLARTFIRNAESFKKFVNFLFFIIVLLLFSGMIESIFNGFQPINSLFSIFGPTYNHNFPMPRFGLSRAQGPFEHSILFGVFVGSGCGIFYYTYFGKWKANLGVFITGAATFFSLSMGAWISGALQFFIICYDRLIKKTKPQEPQTARWWRLIVMSILGYVALDMASNRTPVMIFIQTFAFNELSAAVRIHIWNYGMHNVWLNPVFGLGFKDWVRPSWLTSSVDNFWLANAMRYGFPGIGLLIAAVANILFKLGRAEISDPEVANMRKGVMVTLAGISLAICTVHLWNATFAYLMFLLGSAMWVLDHPSTRDPKAESARGGRGRGAAPPKLPESGSGVVRAEAPAKGQSGRSRLGAEAPEPSTAGGATAETSVGGRRDQDLKRPPGPAGAVRPGRLSSPHQRN